MAFIPPPFPFPEAWPRVFAEQQQRQERKWLTSTTFIPVQWQEPTAAGYYCPTVDPVAVDVKEDDEEEGGGEYEYGYVLSDEWRDRFQSSAQLQQQQQQGNNVKNRKRKPPKKKQKKTKQQSQTINAEAVAAANANRSGHLQREIQAAKTREVARKWKRRGTNSKNPQVEAMETSLNVLFDEFCDAFQPVVWPHDPLHR